MFFLIKSFELIFDIILVIFAFLWAYFFRLSIFLLLENRNTMIHSDYPIEWFLLNSFFVCFVVIGVFIYQNRYSTDMPYKNIVNTLVASVIWATSFILIYFYSREIFFSRLIPMYATFLMFTFLTINHYIFNRILLLFKQQYWKRVLIIWANQVAENIIHSIQKWSKIRQIIWIIDAYGTKKKHILGVPVLAKMNKFEDIVIESKIDEIIQADNLEQTLNIVTFCENRWISYFLAPSLSAGLFHENIEIYHLGKNPVIYLNQTDLIWWNLFFKRIFDILFSILLLPILFIFYIIQGIRWRNFLSYEKRISKWGNFNMYRFSVNEKNLWEDELISDDFEENSKINFLKKLNHAWIKINSLDKVFLKSHIIELPQILNVLKWEMSIIWPRPSFEKEFLNYPEYYKKRFSIMPGITWLWQIRKNAPESNTFDSMFKSDIEYIKNWSFLLDIKIIFKTLFKFF